MGIPIEFKGSIDVHHHVHVHAPEHPNQFTRLLVRIADAMEHMVAGFDQLHTKVTRMDQDIQENVAATGAMNAVVDQLPQLVNDFEARITALVKQSPSMTPTDRLALQQATTDLKAGVTKALAAFADAADNTDEADTGAGTGGDSGGGTGGGTPDPGTGTGGTGTGSGDTGTGSTDPTTGTDTGGGATGSGDTTGTTSRA